MDVNQLALTWVGWPNGEKTCFDLRANLISTKVSASHHKSTQVNASQRKSMQVHASPGQTVSQVAPSFQLASTSDSVCLGLNPLTPVPASLDLSSTSDVITFDQNWHHLHFTSAGGKDLSSNAQIKVFGPMAPEICTKMLKKLSKIQGKIY